MSHTSGETSCRIRLTQRALNDIDEIYDYSLKTWNEVVAERYIDDIQAALARIQVHPGLLNKRPEFSEHLRFYVVNRHILVCDHKDDSVVVLMATNVRMELFDTLKQLEPTLAAEIELLREITKGSGSSGPD